MWPSMASCKLCNLFSVLRHVTLNLYLCCIHQNELRTLDGQPRTQLEAMDGQMSAFLLTFLVPNRKTQIWNLKTTPQGRSFKSQVRNVVAIHGHHNLYFTLPCSWVVYDLRIQKVKGQDMRTEVPSHCKILQPCFQDICLSLSLVVTVTEHYNLSISDTPWQSLPTYPCRSAMGNWYQLGVLI